MMNGREQQGKPGKKDTVKPLFTEFLPGSTLLKPIFNGWFLVLLGFT